MEGSIGISEALARIVRQRVLAHAWCSVCVVFIECGEPPEDQAGLEQRSTTMKYLF
jgi:hypothetical protein